MITTATRTHGSDASMIRRRWWLEVLYILAFYLIYSTIRNQFGSGGNFKVGSGRSLDNAIAIIDVEKAMGLFFEEAVQRPVIGWDWYLQFWNIFYGSLHFAVTIFGDGVPVHTVPASLPLLSEHHPVDHCLRSHRVCHLPVDATPSSQRRRAIRRRVEPYDFVDSLAKVGGTVVVRLGDHGGNLEPVGGHAELAHQLGDVVHHRALPRSAVGVVALRHRGLSVPDALRHRRHRQPLLDRRGRRSGHPGSGLARRYSNLEVDQRRPVTPPTTPNHRRPLFPTETGHTDGDVA